MELHIKPDFNDMLTHLGLYYTKRLRKCIQCISEILVVKEYR